MTELASKLEAALFASGDPVSIARLSLVFEETENKIIEACDELAKEFENAGHGLKILKLGDKLQMCSDPQFASVVTKVLEARKPQMLSNPALETLAVVAYFQPVTTAYISKVRGVDSSYTVSTLNEKKLIEEKGRLDAPGRPILFGTTDVFLRSMNISSLDELPKLPDMTSNNAMDEIKAKIDSLKKEEKTAVIENHSEEVI